MRKTADVYKSKKAENEQNWAKGYIHVVSNDIDASVKPLTVFIKDHQRNCKHKTDRCRVDCVTSKNKSHSYLGLETCPVNLWIGSQLYQVLLLEYL